MDPPSNDCEEAYSPSDVRSFTPPPISKFTQPILDKVSDITIPPNLQEILANVKRQESSKVDPYLPSKPSASFLPGTVNTAGSLYQNTERYSPSSSSRISQSEKATSETSSKETKSTLSTLSDLDLIKKAEEELAAVAAATAVATSTIPIAPVPPPSTLITSPSTSSLVLTSTITPINDTSVLSSQQSLLSSSLSPEPEKSKAVPHKPSPSDSLKKSYAPEQPKPPGLEDEDFPVFPSTPPSTTLDASKTATTVSSRAKLTPKSGVVLSVKRKATDDSNACISPSKSPRTKSRWGQGPSE